jgi:geranylgeranyl pyrophosphate synthase
MASERASTGVDQARLGALAGMVRAELRRQVAGSGLQAQLRDSLVARLEAGDRPGLSGPGPVSLLPVAVWEAVTGRDPSQAAFAGAAMAFLIAAGDLLDDLQDQDISPESVGGAPGAAEMMAAFLALSSAALYSHGQGLDAPGLGRRARAHAIMSALQLRALGGQGRDIELSGERSVSLDEALMTTVQKSGALGRCAAMMGAALATDDERIIEAAGRFGEDLAISRQLLNDISGVLPGGPPGTDIALGRKTAPVTFALSVDPESNTAAKRVQAAMSASPEARERNLEDIRKDILASGGVSYAWILAAVHSERARRAACEISIQHPQRNPAWLVGTA